MPVVSLDEFNRRNATPDQRRAFGNVPGKTLSQSEVVSGSLSKEELDQLSADKPFWQGQTHHPGIVGAIRNLANDYLFVDREVELTRDRIANRKRLLADEIDVQREAADRRSERNQLQRLLNVKLQLERRKRGMPNLSQVQLDNLRTKELSLQLEAILDPKIPISPHLLAKRKRLARAGYVVPTRPKTAPTLPLVGIEPNPGPGKGKNKKQSKQVARARAPAPAPRRRNKARAARGMGPVQITSQPAPVSIGYKSVMRNKMRNTVISHCEQIAEVTAANGSTYSLQVPLQINPGLASTFPWLSQIAQNYEAYEFKKLQFVFIPYVSTATNGWNAMNFDYNPQEESSTQFPTKQSFTDYDGSVQCNAWEAFQMPIRCPNLEGPRVRTIRTGAITGQYDLHNYDHGQFNFAVGASTGTSAIGTLYVCYSIALSRPRISTSGTGQGSLASGLVGYTTGVAKTSVFGAVSTNLPVSVDSTMGLNVSSNGSIGVSNATISFTSGSSSFITTNNTYLVAISLVGTGLAVNTANDSGIASESGYNIILNTNWCVNFAGTVMSSYGIVQMLGVSSDGVTIKCSSADIAATTITTVFLQIAQIPYGLTLTSKEKKFEQYMESIVKKMLFTRNDSLGRPVLMIEEEEKDESDSPVIVPRDRVDKTTSIMTNSFKTLSKK